MNENKMLPEPVTVEQVRSAASRAYQTAIEICRHEQACIRRGEGVYNEGTYARHDAEEMAFYETFFNYCEETAVDRILICVGSYGCEQQQYPNLAQEPQGNTVVLNIDHALGLGIRSQLVNKDNVFYLSVTLQEEISAFGRGAIRKYDSPGYQLLYDKISLFLNTPNHTVIYFDFRVCISCIDYFDQRFMQLPNFKYVQGYFHFQPVCQLKREFFELSRDEVYSIMKTIYRGAEINDCASDIEELNDELQQKEIVLPHHIKHYISSYSPVLKDFRLESEMQDQPSNDVVKHGNSSKSQQQPVSTPTIIIGNIFLGVLTGGVFHLVYYAAVLLAKLITGTWHAREPITFFANIISAHDGANAGHDAQVSITLI